MPGSRIREYLDYGKAFALGRRDLLHLMIYVTNRCNSRCKICGIWKEKKKLDLPIETIRKIVTDKLVTKRTYIGLEGGEFVLHPNYREILSMMNGHGLNYVIFTNGVDADRIIRTVREFNVKGLQMSLDGGPETYKAVRGVDRYQSVVDIVDELKDECEIRLGYVANPWNAPEDFRHVREFCRKNKIGLAVGIYGNVNLLKAKNSLKPMQSIEDDGFYSDYLGMYNSWLVGKIKLPCYSTRYSCLVWPDGRIPLCQQKSIILGNVYKNTLSEIWNSDRTRRLQVRNKGCNGCWISFHRVVDVKLVTGLQKLMPKSMAEKIVGKYEIGK